jgi:glycerol uptake facilitator-like aquaporin
LATGAMLNPARDMAPRLAALVLGWKSEDVFENINFKYLLKYSIV